MSFKVPIIILHQIENAKAIYTAISCGQLYTECQQKYHHFIWQQYIEYFHIDIKVIILIISLTAIWTEDDSIRGASYLSILALPIASKRTLLIIVSITIGQWALLFHLQLEKNPFKWVYMIVAFIRNLVGIRRCQAGFRSWRISACAAKLGRVIMGAGAFTSDYCPGRVSDLQWETISHKNVHVA